MPTLDYTIKKLEEQKRKVNQGDIEVWLNTTHSYIEDQLKSYSTIVQELKLPLKLKLFFSRMEM